MEIDKIRKSVKCIIPIIVCLMLYSLANAGTFTVEIDHIDCANVSYRLYFEPAPKAQPDLCGSDYKYRHAIDLRGYSTYIIKLPGYAGEFCAVATAYNRNGESPHSPQAHFKMGCCREDLDHDGDVDGTDLSIAIESNYLVKEVSAKLGTVCRPLVEMELLQVTVDSPVDEDLRDNPPFSPAFLRIGIN